MKIEEKFGIDLRSYYGEKRPYSKLIKEIKKKISNGNDQL